MREAEVTVASPHRYCATTAPSHRSRPRDRGSALSRTWKNAPSPAAAVSAGSWIASTTAQSITHPNTPETSTDRTIPRGTFSAALTVSSEVWAEASKPVIVYAGSNSASANAHAIDSVRSHTGLSASGSPVKFVTVTSREVEMIGVHDQERGQQPGDDQDPVPAEVGEHAGDPDAEVVQQRLRGGDRGHRSELFEWVERLAGVERPGREEHGPDVDRGEHGEQPGK